MITKTVDVAFYTTGLVLAVIGHYAETDVIVFVGGVFSGMFLFKLVHVCEKRWKEGGNG